MTEVALYETESRAAGRAAGRADLRAGDIVFFCSPSAVRAFAGAWTERPRCVAIGETTARAAREAGFATAVAATPDLEAMVLAAGLDPFPEPAEPGERIMNLLDRPRRLRANPVMRELTAETDVEARHLITPHFVVEGKGVTRRDRQHARASTTCRSTSWSRKSAADLELGLKSHLLFGMPERQGRARQRAPSTPSGVGARGAARP